MLCHEKNGWLIQEETQRGKYRLICCVAVWKHGLSRISELLKLKPEFMCYKHDVQIRR